MKRRISTWISMIAALAMLMTACGGDGSGEGADDAKTLVIGAVAQPPTMDPTANDAAAIPQVLLYNVYETLVKMDSEGNIQPLLAQRWDRSPDGLTYTFHLEPSATFASGNPVTAEDVKWSFDRMMAEDSSAVLKNQMAVVDKVEATEDKLVTVTLKHPSNSWIYDLTSTPGIIFDSQAATDLATTPAGSGPFALKAWNQGTSVVLERNTQYWATPPRFSEVTFRYFSDPNAMNAAMLSGDLDIISNLQAPQAIDQFSDESRFTIVEGVTNGEVVLGMNHQNKALSDVRVRQAIHHAIDRQALVDTVWNGKGELIGSMVPPTDPWYEDLSETYSYDPDRARELLAEAGYAQGLTLRLRLPVLPYATSGGQFVASQLKAVGIDVVVDELEFPGTWVEQVLTQSDYDLTIVAHVEPRDIVKFADPNYYWHYNNPEFTKLIQTADAATDEQAYVDGMKKAAKMLADDAAADWLFLLPNLVVTKPGITGIAKNATSLSFDVTVIAKA